MGGQPPGGEPDGLSRRHDIDVTEPMVQPGQVEHPVRRQRLGHHGVGRDGQVVGHRDDLEIGAEGTAAALDHLADRQHFGVGDVEDGSGRELGVEDGAEHGSGAVLGVAVVMQGQALVGDDDPTTTVEDAAHDRPFPRHGLVGPVQVGITEVGGRRMGGIDRDLGAHDPVSLLVDQGPVDEVGVLAHRHREPGRLVLPRVGPAPVGGHPSDRHEVAASAFGQLGDAAQTPVHGHDDIPRGGPESGGERRLVERVGVEMGDLGRRVRPLMQTAVQDGDGVAGIDKTADDRDPSRPRPADDKDVHVAACISTAIPVTDGPVPTRSLKAKRRRPR